MLAVACVRGNARRFQKSRVLFGKKRAVNINALCDLYERDGVKVFEARAVLNVRDRNEKCARCGFSYFAHQLRGMVRTGKACEEFASARVVAVQDELFSAPDMGTVYHTKMDDGV